MEYILCQFESEEVYPGIQYSGQFYQEVSNGYVIRFSNLDGTDLILEGAYGYFVLNSNPEKPIWSI